jgi:hypothetical protein
MITLGHPQLDRLALQVRARVAEERLGLRGHEHDEASAIDRDDRIGRRLDQRLEAGLGRLGLGAQPRRLAQGTGSRGGARDVTRATGPRGRAAARGVSQQSRGAVHTLT